MKFIRLFESDNPYDRFKDRPSVVIELDCANESFCDADQLVSKWRLFNKDHGGVIEITELADDAEGVGRGALTVPGSEVQDWVSKLKLQGIGVDRILGEDETEDLWLETVRYSTEIPDDEFEDNYNPYSDLKYPLEVVTRDEHHAYRYASGVCYEVDNLDELVELPAGSVTPTEGNQFYEEQVLNYVKYIENGGILQTFPVQVIPPSTYTFEKGLEAIFEWAHDEQFEEFYDEFRAQYSWPDWKTLDLAAENLMDYSDEPEDQWPDDQRQSMQLLKTQLTEFLEDHEADDAEYHLTDMNHRFQAVLRLGLSTVLAEPV